MDHEAAEEERLAQMKGDKRIYPLVGNRILTVTEKKDQSALPYLDKRFEYFLPVETVDVDEVLQLIEYIRVNPNRACSPEEVCGIVEQIKAFLKEAVSEMPHHKRYNNDRGQNNS